MRTVIWKIRGGSFPDIKKRDLEDLEKLIFNNETASIAQKRSKGRKRKQARGVKRETRKPWKWTG